MGRIRTVKPEFFLDEELAELPIFARMLFIGLFTQADRRGRMEDRPKRIRANVFPYDDVDVNGLLQLLHESGFVIRYEVGGVKLLQVTNFEKHQRISGKEAQAESEYPAYEPDNYDKSSCCDKESDSESPDKHRGSAGEATEKHEGSAREATEITGREGKGKERKKTPHQHAGACACEVLAEVVDRQQERLQALFPEADIPVVREKLLAHYRNRDVPPLDPWLVVLRWFQGEFQRGKSFPTGRASPGGYAEQWRDAALREAEAFLRGFGDDTDAEHEGGRGAVLVGHGGAVQGPHAAG